MGLVRFRLQVTYTLKVPIREKLKRKLASSGIDQYACAFKHVSQMMQIGAAGTL